MLRREEVTNEKQKQPVDIQGDTVQMYCTGIEERIRKASSVDEAKIIADEACLSFNQECLSDIVKNSLRRYVAGLVERHWSTG